MKTLYNFSQIILIMIIMAGCSDAIGIDDPILSAETSMASFEQSQTRSLKVEDLTFEEVKRYLDQHGYDTATLTEYEDYYLIDSDMGFSKERLAEGMGQPATRMAYTKILDQKYHRLNLNLNYSANEGLKAFEEALYEWNNIPDCSIDFSSSIENNKPSRPQIYVDITEDPLISGPSQLKGLIYTEMPLDGKSGGRVLINSNHESWKNIAYTQKIYLIMHALGHLVGCSHYDFNSKDYPGTQHDPNTFMQNETGLKDNNWLWQGFTAKDIQALKIMYPLAPATYSVTCQPEITGSDKTKMVVGSEYTLTATYDYDWVFNPTYTYEVIRGKEFVTTSVKDNKLKLKFTKGGSCKIWITANDALGEKDPDGNAYTFDAEYHAYPDKPTFTYPSSIRMGEFCTFKMALDNPEYKNITYTYSVKEVLFDNNTARSATIEQDGKGTARIRFNDYGKYYVTAKAVYGGKSAEFKFLYTHLYRPEPEISPMLVEPGPNFGSAGIPEFTTEPTGENLIGIYRMRIRFDKAALMPHRIVCQVTGDRRQQFWQSPGRVDYRIIDYCTEQRQVILTEADSAYVDLSDERSYFHPDSVNYKEHRTVIYPYATAKYTEEDWCGLVNTTYSNAE